MIKFFRRIRQRLLTENKFSKYLIYAIGEIILVVIGILIALQINNLNERNKVHAKQETYLTLIKGEMLNNLESLKIENSYLSKSIKSQQQILELMHDQSVLDSIGESYLSKLMVPALSITIGTKYENGILTELIASGSLKDIENDTISNTLASWEGIIYNLREEEALLRGLFNKNNDYFELNGAFRTIFDHTNYSEYVGIEKLRTNTSNKNVLKSTVFENILLIQLAASRHLEKGVYPKYQAEIEKLIDLIEQELNVK